MVRWCDRIVARKKDKLRAEMAKTVRSRGVGSNSVDPVTPVKREILKNAFLDYYYFDYYVLVG